MTEQRDVIVIGGGQAGLAAGYFLAQQSSCLCREDPHLQPDRVAEQPDALASAEDAARALSPGQRSHS